MAETNPTEERRLELQALLETLLGSDNVYFQPPSSKKIEYPCIVYNLDYMSTSYANNFPYIHANRYSVTYISKRPDTKIPDILKQLQFCSFVRFYTTDSLNHYVFRLYF